MVNVLPTGNHMYPGSLWHHRLPNFYLICFAPASFCLYEHTSRQLLPFFSHFHNNGYIHEKRHFLFIRDHFIIGKFKSLKIHSCLWKLATVGFATSITQSVIFYLLILASFYSPANRLLRSQRLWVQTWGKEATNFNWIYSAYNTLSLVTLFSLSLREHYIRVLLYLI